MDSRSPLSGAQDPNRSRFSLSSLAGWWPLRLVPGMFTAQMPVPTASPLSGSPRTDNGAVFFSIDVDGSPNTPAPSTATASPGLPGVPAVSFPSTVQQEKKDSRYSPAVNATNFKGASDLKPLRISSVVSTNGSSSVSMAAESFGAAESSRSSTPRPATSSASTPRILTPSTMPLPEEVYLNKSWGMLGPSTTSAAPASGNGNSRAGASFLVPISLSTTPDALTAEQMRTPPACVELPGPQSLFVRGGASSGCDRQSIDLLQRSVLAEHLSAPASHS